MTYRAVSFVRRALLQHLDRQSYPRATLASSVKLTLAIAIAAFPAAYVFGFNSTAPSAIAYVVGSHIGASFRITTNRVIGVVAGSVLPSVFKFFICWTSSVVWQNMLNNVVLFFWTALAMFVFFSKSYVAYAGIVCAYIAAKTLLDQCPADATESRGISTVSYASLVQTSLGMLVLVIVEFAIYPQSSVSLLRHNIQKTLTRLQTVFEAYYHYRPTADEEARGIQLDEAMRILHAEIPALLSKQRLLLMEADVEPVLWRPKFSAQKHEAVLQLLTRLQNNLTQWHKIIEWQEQTRKERPTESEQWDYSSSSFQAHTVDAFESLYDSFGEKFLFSDPEETSLYFQMKEAFRMADKDGNGVIDATELRDMIRRILQADITIKDELIDSVVESVLAVADKDGGGTIAFDEFMDAIEDGMTIDIQQIRNEISESSSLTQKQQRKDSEDNSPIQWDHRELGTIDVVPLQEASNEFLGDYVRWLRQNDRYERIPIEELLIFSCFVHGAKGIAEALLELQHVVSSDN